MSGDRYFDRTPNPVRRIDAKYAVLNQNAAAGLAFGEPGDEPCYRSAFGRDEPCEGCRLGNLREDGSVESWYVVDERSERPVYREVSLIPVPREDADGVEFFEVLRDATHHIGLEQHLIRNSEKLEEQVEERTLELLKLVEETRVLESNLRDLRSDQAALVQTEKMATVGRLAAGISHELNTPLGSLTSGVDALQSFVGRLEEETKRSAEVDERCAPMLKQCRELLELHAAAAERIRTVVRSLKEFTHLDRATAEDYDLHEGLEATLALLQHETRGRIEVRRRFEELPRVRCRPDALNQVFMNLLENSVYAIDGPGTIRIEVVRSDDEHVRVVIEDSGSGIARDDLPHVFEAGFTTKPRGVGTGLGLAVSAAIVRDHHGTLEVESEPGRFTRFTLELPIEAYP